MKKFITIIFCFVFPSLVGAQSGYVDVNDEIYDFLSRMNSIGVLDDYNSFELPKSRNEIKKHLLDIINKTDDLDRVDLNKLKDFLIEFEYDLFSSNNFSDDLFSKLSEEHFFSGREKFLYKYHDRKGNALFINFVGLSDYLHLSENGRNNNSILYRFGGEVRGALFENLGFHILSTNGSFFGSRSLAQNYSTLRYNYKFNQENEDNSGDYYFDETSAYLTYQNDFSEIKIGNDRNLVGHGFSKVILGDNAPRMDYLNLKLKYKSVEFSFFHGKLLGTQSLVKDSIQGDMNKVNDKYIGYHRLGLNLSRHFNFGLGEMVIYANRNLDLTYLNPVGFYKSAEHANQDRDNTFLFLDFQNNSIDKLTFYSTILIDDIDFAKVGTGWYGNKAILSFGLYSGLLYDIVPLDMEIQYIKIDPYVYTHRITDNNFTNGGYNLASELLPNSSSTNIRLYYRPHYRVNMELGFRYQLHGANTTDENGNLISNFGGDINQGRRSFDPEEVYFLKGEREIFREYDFLTTIEPVKNWHFSISIKYQHNNLADFQNKEELFTTFSLSTKL